MRQEAEARAGQGVLFLAKNTRNGTRRKTRYNRAGRVPRGGGLAGARRRGLAARLAGPEQGAEKARRPQAGPRGRRRRRGHQAEQPQRGRVASSAGLGRERRGRQARPGRPGTRPGRADSGERGRARRVCRTRRGLAGGAWLGLAGAGERCRTGALARRVERTRRGPGCRAWLGLTGSGERGLAGALACRVGRTSRGLAGSVWPGLVGPGERGLVWRARASAAWRARPGERCLEGPARGLADPARSGGPGLETAIGWTRHCLAGSASAVWSGGPRRARLGLGGSAWRLRSDRSGRPWTRGLVWRTRPGERGLEDPARSSLVGSRQCCLVWWARVSSAWSGGPGLESAVWRTRRGLAGPGERGLAGPGRRV